MMQNLFAALQNTVLGVIDITIIVLFFIVSLLGIAVSSAIWFLSKSFIKASEKEVIDIKAEKVWFEGR
ncbi:hypothetical protein [Gallibacterium genomosp. 1]|uniref:Uncharacterized protein n=1 Tax=Gallibacterium genomosp. 1 TaxID=155515 RepID=A0A0A2Y6L9_9PAST|nr:hypothetical protein [Gallibacterium genomosp. 1]KGQ38777.1 hypothetical protein JP36_02190 [Gallibacterium genomosp. 1]OBW99750.1 hypothetical protein QV04_07860 [Gallibacterium genomosp. 1]OBX00407.1 hypothetical protein QV05_07840 [Gallibacterium genomosp. 1]